MVCPFKGLAAFDVADAPYFFGRERLIAELVARLVGAPLLGVVGPSGSGKSSVVRAGLLPALADGVLPGSERWAQVAHAAGRASAATSSRRPPRGVGDGRRVVLAVDQFEETFTACGDEQERAAFVAELVRARDDAARRRARAARRLLRALRRLPRARRACWPPITCSSSAMRRDELRRAVERPGRARRPVASSPSSPTRWWTTSSASRARCRCCRPRCSSCGSGATAGGCGWPTYERSGGVRGAVARHAEEAFGRLDERQQAVARGVLLRLTAEGAGGAVERRRIPLAELDRARRRRRAGRRPAHRPAPADGQRRRGRARARGAAARVAAAARLARGGRRRAPRCSATSPTRRASGTSAGATPASSTAARGWPPRWSGAPATSPSSTAPRRAFLTPPRDARARARGAGACASSRRRGRRSW